MGNPKKDTDYLTLRAGNEDIQFLVDNFKKLECATKNALGLELLEMALKILRTPNENVSMPQRLIEMREKLHGKEPSAYRTAVVLREHSTTVHKKGEPTVFTREEIEKMIEDSVAKGISRRFPKGEE